jgi:hypothetical protein
MRRHSENVIFVLFIVGAIALGLYIKLADNTIKVIDGCEYIQTYSGHGWNITHKGNCTNIIHYKK